MSGPWHHVCPNEIIGERQMTDREHQVISGNNQHLIKAMCCFLVTITQVQCTVRTLIIRDWAHFKVNERYQIIIITINNIINIIILSGSSISSTQTLSTFSLTFVFLTLYYVFLRPPVSGLQSLFLHSNFHLLPFQPCATRGGSQTVFSAEMIAVTRTVSQKAGLMLNS